MIELEGTEEIGPRMHRATHLRWPDDSISRRTNHYEKGKKRDSFLTLVDSDMTSGSFTRRRT